MTLGAAYNVFDGEELLVPSVRRMRRVADKVVVVYAEYSNWGEINPDLAPALERLNGIADVFIPFRPKIGVHPHENEIAMRNVGMVACRDCDVFMTMDCDEFYRQDQFKWALKTFVAEGADSSACPLQHYFKFADVRLVPPPAMWVPLFYRNDGLRLFVHGIDWPVLVDPTRRLAPGKVRVFDRSEIEMHHLSHVRNNIRRKLRNSSARTNYENQIESIAAAVEAWSPGQLALGTPTEKIRLLFPELSPFAS
jgi:hypothetical protein